MADDVLKVTLVGQKNLTQELQKLKACGPLALQTGLYKVACEMMRNAKRRVPVRTGVLRGSGYVALPTAQGLAARCEMGFGGAAKAYALVQHERLDFHHKEGEAKYLTNAVDAIMGSTAAAIFTEAANAAIARFEGAQQESDVPTDPGAEAAKRASHPGRDKHGRFIGGGHKPGGGKGRK